MKEYQYDYLVVGGGLAGLYLSHIASFHGRVTLLSKTKLDESNSYLAQGGIAAVTAKDDSIFEHFEDTIVAGRGLCDYSAVETLVKAAPDRIKDLIAEGFLFDTENGEFSLGLEGGHHRNRILHAGGDATGRLLSSFLIEQAKKNPSIDIFEDCVVLEILKNEELCVGVATFNLENEEESLFLASHTIMCTGGAGAIYKRTTNPATTIGDGLALCYNAGCTISDIEFIQFHPSAIYTPLSNEAFLVSEAVRGEGAHLYNTKGERFMLEQHEQAELAPRDVVARAIFNEIQQQSDKYVYLSLAHLDPQFIKKRFPSIYQFCLSKNIDMTDKIPIAPAAHYTVGGVRVDINGCTNIPHLYVCGELASTGIMGGNRLASNSLIECLVFGRRVLEDTLRNKSEIPQAYQRSERIHLEKQNGEVFLALKEELAELMNAKAGIVRNGEDMQAALERVRFLERNTFDSDKEYFTLAAKRLLTVAKLILSAALYRKESRGGHFRSDYPEQDKSWELHVEWQKGKKAFIGEVDKKLSKEFIDKNIKKFKTI